MKKINTIILIISISLLSYSCKSSDIKQDKIIGSYYSRTNNGYADVEYSLTLYQENRFNIIINNQQCNGIWKLLEKKLIFLECDKIKDIEGLSSNFLNQRKYKIKILDSKKIEIGIIPNYLDGIPLNIQDHKKKNILLERVSSVVKE